MFEHCISLNLQFDSCWATGVVLPQSIRFAFAKHVIYQHFTNDEESHSMKTIRWAKKGIYASATVRIASQRVVDILVVPVDVDCWHKSHYHNSIIADDEWHLPSPPLSAIPRSLSAYSKATNVNVNRQIASIIQTSIRRLHFRLTNFRFLHFVIENICNQIDSKFILNRKSKIGKNSTKINSK